MLVVDGDQAIGFRGGLGPALAAVHLLTLGMLTTTAIGSAVQLLPVATRRALVAVWPIKLVFWLTVPGLTLLIAGMFVMHTMTAVVAAVATTAGLLLFAGLLADNLRRAGSLPVRCRLWLDGAGVARRLSRLGARACRSITTTASCPITARPRSPT